MLNNASLCYRIAPLVAGESPQIEPLPDGVDLEAIHPVTSIRTYPNGDRNMNPVNLLPGSEAHLLGDRAYDEALKRLRGEL